MIQCGGDRQGTTAREPLRVLIIGDALTASDSLGHGLEAEGYGVVVERAGAPVTLRATTNGFDVLLLDMHGGGNIEILFTLRQSQITVPILVLSASAGLDDRVQGLDAGADDYLVKPFEFSELLARMRALSRRRAPAPTVLQVGPISLDLMRREVTKAGVPGVLFGGSGREFELLACLMRHEGQAVSRDVVAREVWREPARTLMLDNLIDVYIARLRRRLGRELSLVHTIRGIGFMMRDGAP